MTENLTDEQLRDLQENAETYNMVHSPAVRSAVAELFTLREMINAEIVGTDRTELIALRTERAKLEGALRKIAQWEVSWPEENYPGYAGMAVVTAREAVPRYPALAQPAESGATEKDHLWAKDIQRDQAQKDAKDARALLAITKAIVSDHAEVCSCGRCGLRARIEAMLEQKP